jgi:adenylate cyclase
VRKSGSRIRITAQLIDARTGKNIWAERYDHDLTDIFAVQDEITHRVAGAIEPELLKVEGQRSTSRSARNMTA